MAADGNQTYHGEHFVIYKNTESPYVLGTNIVLQANYTSKINKLIEKEITFVVTRGKGQGEGELDEGSQRVQSSSSKTRIGNVMQNMINMLMLYITHESC